ncbi:hypothetical protein HHS34_005225 [Acidithiobacillus montserratensis]|uniref:Uncharacterized protein n=1 Tax=Acidithiobacillus montserratensis TaxID=2729135 RepID=A0ACD5HIK0_9PROT|nr:hypothetical protein [Acidithiobacillus montserratensis]MBU2747821.1 hypothetical protein [Acidithiobacillus montserratensis]
MPTPDYNTVTDEYLCREAFIADGAPDLWVAAAWAINGYRDDDPAKAPEPDNDTPLFEDISDAD